ncbi:protein D1 [Rhipicephalus microplus]|uniref:protein D1 n=1 Tax=Rhipicephalus microplus TaxID=6941 RepID=UPI003F6D8A01
MDVIHISTAFILLTLWSGAQAEQFDFNAALVKSPVRAQEVLQTKTNLLIPAGQAGFPSQKQSGPRTDLWTAAGLVDDLSLGAAPVAQLKVVYGSIPVTINGTLTPQQTAEMPEVALVGAINCVPPFALLMLDPDAPSRQYPSLRSWLHWMVINANTTRKLHKGEQAVEYNGPTPPEGTGPHRYVFLAFCQRGKRLKITKLKTQRRKKFWLKAFCRKIGDTVPFGGTFFYAENVRRLRRSPVRFT